MPKVINIIILISVVLIAGIIAAIFINVSVKKKRIKNMYQAIEDVFKDGALLNPSWQFFKSTEPEYEYKLITDKNVYYFKVIPNFDGEEITINNSVKWQLRKSFNDSTMRFVPDVERFMRFELPEKIEEDIKIEKTSDISTDEMTFSDLGISIDNPDEEKKEKKFKKNIKMYIIYPNARSLLMYINECEMKFVNPKTDVYGTRVVTFVDFSKNRDSLLK